MRNADTSVLVTGGTGFLGRAVIGILRADGVPVAATSRSRQTEPGVRWFDSPTPVALGDAVRRSAPASVVHCLFPEWTADERAYRETVDALHAHLFEACADTGATLVLVSSSAVYAPVAEPVMLDEDAPIGPVTPYGRAKVAVEHQAAEYVQSRGLRLVTARLFNLIGPGQRSGMLVPDWMAQFADMRDRHAVRRLRVRTIATARDFVDVRDAAQAVARMTGVPPTSVVNVCSGEAVRLGALLAELQEITGIRCDVDVEQPAPARDDVVWQRGSRARAASLLNWHPARTWRDSLRDAWAARAAAA